MMLSPRWSKLLADVRVARGRFIGVAVAMSITIAVIAAILTARVILDREMNRNYLDTEPPSATLMLDAVDGSLLDEVRKRSGVIAAERGTVVNAKTQLPSGESMGLLLRVVPDFTEQRIAKFYPQSGAWPPPKGAVLIERSVARMMPIDIGSTLHVELSSGSKHTLRIAGTVHDPGNAPAWQERVVYGYITTATLAALDPNQSLNQLHVIVDKHDIPSIESATRSLALWLRARGQAVHFIRIPPPGAHPHQWQIVSVSLLLLAFGLLGIVLEAALLAIVIGGLLAPQVRQIAVMKAIGARTSQIVGMYSALIAVLTLIALLVGLPIGVFAGHQLAIFIADLLNFNIANAAVPESLYGICIALGFAIPMIATLVPILSAARKSVRESIDYFGATSNPNNRWLQRVFNRLRANNVSVQLALRNLARRKSQLTLALTLLVLTGAVFIVSGNALRLWQTVTSQSIEEQRYDVLVNLRRAEPEAAVFEVIKSIVGVRVVESTAAQFANVDDGDGLSLSTKGLRLVAVAPQSTMLALNLVEGRWLQAEDHDAVVLNSAARAAMFAQIKVGDSISLLMNRRPVRLQVVGIARGLFAEVGGYTTQQVFADVSDIQASTRGVLVGLSQGVDADQIAKTIEQALETAQLPARGVFTKASASVGITAHTYIFIALLLLIVVSVAKIATAGLASCMSTTVIERTREFGVMRTLGARAHAIQNSIIIEAIFIGVASWVIALVLSIPLTLFMEKLLSDSVQRPPPIVFSPLVALLWLVGVTFVAIIASVVPAKRAAGLTIRQTLAHV